VTRVGIHRGPGCDPVEPFFAPGNRLVKLRAATALARRGLGLRSALSVIPFDVGSVLVATAACRTPLSLDVAGADQGRRGLAVRDDAPHNGDLCARNA
jgi:hypothetical protein